VNFIGEFSHWVNGSTTAVIDGTGVTIQGFVVHSPTSATATFVIAPDAPSGSCWSALPGCHTVTLTSPLASGSEILIAGFQVMSTPAALVSIGPFHLAPGASAVVTIKGSRQDVAEAALRYSKEIFYASHNWQPFFLEGTKTLAYELWEQLGFKIPDNIVFPVGYGSNVCGCERGFAELKRRGEIDRVPRLFGVQAANCAPYYAAFVAGVEELVPTAIATTIAEGIASSKPTRVREVLRAVRGSGGSLLAVVIFHGLFDFFSVWPAGVIGPGMVMTILMVFWAVRVFKLHGPATLAPADKVSL
jgi:hypothetical protein